jgi:hypothetical protein
LGWALSGCDSNSSESKNRLILQTVVILMKVFYVCIDFNYLVDVRIFDECAEINGSGFYTVGGGFTPGVNLTWGDIPPSTGNFLEIFFWL